MTKSYMLQNEKYGKLWKCINHNFFSFPFLLIFLLVSSPKAGSAPFFIYLWCVCFINILTGKWDLQLNTDSEWLNRNVLLCVPFTVCDHLAKGEWPYKDQVGLPVMKNLTQAANGIDATQINTTDYIMATTINDHFA